MVQALEAGGQRIAGYSSALLGPPQPLPGLRLLVASGAIPVLEPRLQLLLPCPAEAAWGKRGLSHLHHPHYLWPVTLAPQAPLTMWGPHQLRAFPRRPGELQASRQWPCLDLRRLSRAMGSCLWEQRRLWLLLGVPGRRWPAWTTWQYRLPLLGPRLGLGDTAPSSGEGCIEQRSSFYPLGQQEG